MVQIKDIKIETKVYIDPVEFRVDDLNAYKTAHSIELPLVHNWRYLGILNLMDVLEVKNFEGDWYSHILKKVKTISLEDEASALLEGEETIFPVENEDNIYLGYVKREDIQCALEVKRCGQALNSCRIMESEFEAILDSSQDGIHVTDGEGVTVRFNKACERIDNVKREDIIGKSMEEMVAKGVYSESVALRVKKEKNSVSMIQEVSGKQIMATGTPIFHGVEIFRIVVNSRDVTELNELKHKLESATTVNEEYKAVLDRLESERLGGFIANSHAMQQVLDLALRVSKVDSTILIQGESGVGKGVISQLIHRNCSRKDKSFMKIDCGVIPEKLLESELFGYEKGAFTGAQDSGKIGLVELADGGTLFLDEIGELPLLLQAKLLRVLQDREFLRVGGKKPISVDIRIIAATNKDLKALVTEGEFREDLYYRLNVIPIQISPLRERREDILPLIDSTLKRVNEKFNLHKAFGPDVLKCLINYDWPGNVRELENIVERLAVVSLEEIVSLADLPEFISQCYSEGPTILVDNISYKDALERFEKKLILNVKNRSTNTKEMAKELSIDRSTVRRKMRKYEIPFDFENEE